MFFFKKTLVHLKFNIEIYLKQKKNQNIESFSIEEKL